MDAAVIGAVLIMFFFFLFLFVMVYGDDLIALAREWMLERARARTALRDDADEEDAP